MVTSEQAMLRQWAERACARREHSRASLRRKLIERGATHLDASAIVDHLVAEGFVDDERFARAYLHDQFHFSHWGVAKIMEHLRYEHGVGEETLRAVREVISPAEEAAALVTLLLPRLRSAELPLTTVSRAKLACFARQKGFAYTIFGVALQTALNELENEQE